MSTSEPEPQSGGNREEQPTKRPYVTPVLTKFGDVALLTRGVHTANSTDPAALSV